VIFSLLICNDGIMEASNDNFPSEEAMLKAKVRDLVRRKRSRRLQKSLREIQPENIGKKLKTR